jgi:hypothetical protein
MSSSGMPIALQNLAVLRRRGVIYNQMDHPREK